jgi:hypothetical protein
MRSHHLLFLAETQPMNSPRTHIVLAPSKLEPLREVFAEAMLEDTSTHQRRSAFDWVASTGVHFAILTMLLILPLYFTTRLDSRKVNLTFLATPATPPGPPPAPLNYRSRAACPGCAGAATNTWTAEQPPPSSQRPS